MGVESGLSNTIGGGTGEKRRTGRRQTRVVASLLGRIRIQSRTVRI